MGTSGFGFGLPVGNWRWTGWLRYQVMRCGSGQPEANKKIEKGAWIGGFLL